ncbi:hypothetical protein [Flavobacterium sp.]|uniref:hypothetical protein n=1 Tax=Flavobacterium sp. TaxID=239 RepID=UPI00286A1136|nr:hypothetical protein [Flavobacterium sp.]
MKTTFKNIALLFLTTIALASCTPEAQTTTAALKNVAPENGKSFSADEASQPISFRWTPLVPKPQTVIYRLKVWQLMQGQNSAEAMRTNPPIVTKDVDNITQTTVAGIYTGPCRPPYLCDYVWSVEAITINNGTITTTVISNPTAFFF